jgi:hypothetical protein
MRMLHIRSYMPSRIVVAVGVHACDPDERAPHADADHVQSVLLLASQFSLLLVAQAAAPSVGATMSRPTPISCTIPRFVILAAVGLPVADSLAVVGRPVGDIPDVVGVARDNRVGVSE